MKFQDYNSTLFNALKANSNLTKEYISLYRFTLDKGHKGRMHIYKGGLHNTSAPRYTHIYMILVAKDLYNIQILPHYPRLDGTITHRNIHNRQIQNYKMVNAKSV